MQSDMVDLYFIAGVAALFFFAFFVFCLWGIDLPSKERTERQAKPEGRPEEERSPRNWRKIFLIILSIVVGLCVLAFLLGFIGIREIAIILLGALMVILIAVSINLWRQGRERLRR